ncbi:hypothetical protein SAMN02745121_06151 [Nannocystis exedens]|uniref:Uncharacterized protein n=1 Tax=Nannocystis exedens TaxID=54 RepID=A0A1I2EN32_9BACT|nr:hypothetical protein [Nannocystis exedens]PCC73929.1 hypothetical protein NAEX_07018 [Nannocystis exedens]SFE94113.1 hypothetical protein SAMN02745121_06151 [Nannocystis exedens]
MSFRSPRPSVRGFSGGALLAALGLFLALYGTIVNIAEASRALAASKESLAKSIRTPVASLEARRTIDVHRRPRAPQSVDCADVRAAGLAPSPRNPADPATTRESTRDAAVTATAVRPGAARR